MREETKKDREFIHRLCQMGYDFNDIHKISCKIFMGCTEPHTLFHGDIGELNPDLRERLEQFSRLSEEERHLIHHRGMHYHKAWWQEREKWEPAVRELGFSYIDPNKYRNPCFESLYEKYEESK